MPVQKNNRNYYEVLHVSRDAPVEIIHGSYRTMMQQLRNHPDLGGDTATAALINEAHAVLGDAARRADYDARLDILAEVTQGAAEPESESESESAAPAHRILDPSIECVFCESPHDQGKMIEVDSCCLTCGSPLCAAKTQRIESEGQRVMERIDKQQDVVFYTHWEQPRGFAGRTEDISLNGLRLVTKEALTVGQRIKIVSELLTAVATITHCMQERRGWRKRYVAGVSFVTLRFVRSVGGFVSERV